MIKLNEKEREIIKLLSEGKGQKAIAREICASKRVVEYSIESICLRVGIPVKAAALVGWYYKNAENHKGEERA